MFAYVRINGVQLKKIVFPLLVVLYFVFLACVYWKNASTLVPKFEWKLTGNRPFLIDTPGYRLPDYDPFDKSVLSFLEPAPKDLGCSKGQRLLTTGLSNYMTSGSEMRSALRFHKEYLVDYGVSVVSCCYRGILRNNSDPEFPDTVFSFSNECHKVEEYITFIPFGGAGVFCESEGKVIYKNIHFFVNLLDRSRKLVSDGENKNDSRPLSVMVIGIDSVSRLNMRRYMPKTVNILNKYDAIDLRGLNKVDENTYPNLIAFLTGKFKTHWDKVSSRKMGQPFFDDFPMMWKNFSDLGYTTAFAEDCSSLGLFHYLDIKRGFIKPPTDFYLHPYIQAAEETLGWNGHSLWISSCKGCLGLVPSISALMHYVGDLSQVLRDVPTFSFIWSSAVSHDRINFAGLVDDPVTELISRMLEGNYWNNTIVLLFADHGVRFGNIRKTFIGRTEENLPFGYFIVPKWFKQAYPKAHENLVYNQHRLVTHFDLRTTLLDIAHGRYMDERYISTEFETGTLPSAFSLFTKIPGHRTCLDALISVQYCSGIRAVDAMEDPITLLAAQYLFELLNRGLNSFPECYQFEVYDVNSGYLLTPFDDQRTVNEKPLFYEIQWTVQPGDIILEAVVEVTRTSSRGDSNNIDRVLHFTLQGTISRINAYEGQSNCIKHTGSEYVKYCLCKNLVTLRT